jgi:tetratricopeptide (TPR) repeat protein
MPVFVASNIFKNRSESSSGKKHVRLLFLPLALLVFSIYTNTLRAPYFFDDEINITRNPHIRLTQITPDGLIKAGFESHIPNRPVANISFGLNYYFGGYHVFGYHLVNLVIHMITGLLLYLLVKTTLLLSWGTDRDASILKPPAAGSEPAYGWRSLDPSWVSFWAASLWLVHPVQTQSVTYIVQRMNSMATLFCVLSLLLYARGRISQKLRFNPSRRPSTHPYVLFAGSLVGGLLAFGSKETAATLPFFILLYELYFFQDLSWAWVTRNYLYVGIVLVLFFITAAVYMGDHPWDKILAGYARRDFTLNQRVLTEFRVVIFYLSLLIWPHPSRLNLQHDFALSYSLFDPLTTVMSLGVIVGLLALGIYLAPRQRILSFCLLWFLGNLVIESSVIGLELVFEHRLYMPSMFLSLAAVMLFCRYVKLRWLQAVLLGMVVMVSAFGTFERNKVWKDEVTFYRDCVQKSPTKARARDGLGSALLKRGQVEEAIAQYNESLRLAPDFASAHNNLGIALIRSENFSQAIYHFQEALRLVPGYADAFYNLNKLEENLRIDGEITKTKSKLTRNPEDPANHYALGNLYMRRDKLNEAKAHYQKSLELDSEYHSALNKLASIYALTGNYDKAISLFQEVITRQPDNPDAFFYIACVYAKQNKKTEAIGWLKKAAERGYRNPDIFKNGLDLDRVLRPSFDGEKRPAVETGH